MASHGVRGELRCAILTDFPERFSRTKVLFLGESHTPYTLERSRLSQGGLLLKLGDVDTREAATALRGNVLYIPASEAVLLPPGSYYWHQILGLEVQTTDGETLGTIADIIETGSNDVYVVRGAERETLIPAIADVIRDVDLDRRVVTVKLLEGLI